VIAAHFREYWLFGLFFAVIAPLQLAWAYLASRPAVRAAVLVAGAVGNLTVALVWLVSRTVGLPIGPDAWQAESVHLPDVVATLDEIAIALLAAALLRPRIPGGSRVALGGAWTLAGLSLIGAMVGAGSGHG
jgi:hypothetical protein